MCENENQRENRSEHSIRMSGKNNPMYGKKRPELMERLKEYNTGKKHTEEHKTKISESCMGRKHTEESKKKMSLAKVGRKRPMHVIEAIKKVCSIPILQFTITGRLLGSFYSIKEAHRQTGISEFTISKALKTTFGPKLGKGYVWRYKSEFTDMEYIDLLKESLIVND